MTGGSAANGMEDGVAERGFVLDGGVGLNHGGAESGAINRSEGGREVFELSEREDIEFG